MSDQAPGHVVVVERMRGGAVDERGIVRRGLEVLSPHHRGAGTRSLARPFGRNRAGRLARAGKRDADAILDRALGHRQRLVGNRLEPRRDKEIDDIFRVLHVARIRVVVAVSAIGNI
jgi:hypothetical protein